MKVPQPVLVEICTAAILSDGFPVSPTPSYAFHRQVWTEVAHHTHMMDDHGLSRTRPKDKNDGAGVKSVRKRKATGAIGEQVPSKKRKTLEGNIELAWPSRKQFSPTHPLKKVQSGSSTITPSLLSRSVEKVKSPSPLIDLTVSEPSTGMLGAQTLDGKVVNLIGHFHVSGDMKKAADHEV